METIECKGCVHLTIPGHRPVVQQVGGKTEHTTSTVKGRERISSGTLIDSLAVGFVSLSSTIQDSLA